MMSDHPIATLVFKDGHMETQILTSLPPPLEILIPFPSGYLATKSIDSTPLLDRYYKFRLSHFVDKNQQWWLYDNEGRTLALKDGFVYLEVAP